MNDDFGQKYTSKNISCRRLNDLISSIDRKTLVEFYTDKWLDQIHLYCICLAFGCLHSIQYCIMYVYV